MCNFCTILQDMVVAVLLLSLSPPPPALYIAFTIPSDCASDPLSLEEASVTRLLCLICIEDLLCASKNGWTNVSHSYMGP